MTQVPDQKTKLFFRQNYAAITSIKDLAPFFVDSIICIKNITNSPSDPPSYLNINPDKEFNLYIGSSDKTNPTLSSLKIKYTIKSITSDCDIQIQGQFSTNPITIRIYIIQDFLKKPIGKKYPSQMNLVLKPMPSK